MDMEAWKARTDWVRLEKAFREMSGDLGLYIPEDFRPSGESDDDIAAFGKEIEYRGMNGGVSVYESDVLPAQESGELPIACMLTPKRSLGHRFVLRFFNGNTLFALRDAEKHALCRRVVTALQGRGFDVRWSGHLNDTITISGKWA
jgi:hypothetical protein